MKGVQVVGRYLIPGPFHVRRVFFSRATLYAGIKCSMSNSMRMRRCIEGWLGCGMSEEGPESRVVVGDDASISSVVVGCFALARGSGNARVAWTMSGGKRKDGPVLPVG